MVEILAGNAGQTWTCPKHGYQGRVIGVSVFLDRKGRPREERNCCMDCWIEHMDATMQQLVPVPPQDGD